MFREAVLASTLAIFTGAFEFLAAFLVWPMTAVFGALIHIEWPSSIYVISFLVVVPIIIGSLMWTLSPANDRSMAVHVATASALVSLVLISIDLLGWTKFNIFAVVCGVPVLCLTLAIHIAMRNKKAKGLDHIFDQAGVPGATMEIHRVEEDETTD